MGLLLETHSAGDMWGLESQVLKRAMNALSNGHGESVMMFGI